MVVVGAVVVAVLVNVLAVICHTPASPKGNASLDTSAENFTQSLLSFREKFAGAT